MLPGCCQGAARVLPGCCQGAARVLPELMYAARMHSMHLGQKIFSTHFAALGWTRALVPQNAGPKCIDIPVYL